MRGARRSGLVGLVAGLLAAASAPAAAQNQRTSLTVTGLPLSVTSTVADDFEAGFVSLGTFTFTVDLTTNAGRPPGFVDRVTTVAVRCGSPCPTSGTLPVGALQWRRGDQVTWTPLSTAWADVETRAATFNGSNDPWSNTVAWRYLVSWTGSPPTALPTTWQLELQLTVTAP